MSGQEWRLQAGRSAFVERLRARRIELGMRQEDVAEVLGVEKMQICRWELGKRWPRAGAAQRWAEALGVRVVGGSVAELFRPEVPPCGTRSGYLRHRRRGERCPQCWQAHSDYNTLTYWRRKGVAA